MIKQAIEKIVTREDLTYDEAYRVMNEIMPVAKHGNRAASSKSGAADCLEALGVNLNQTPETCVQELKDVGLCFFFAQKYHTSMKYVGAIRKELGFRTIFNILGPITNPCKPCYQVLGVYGEYLVEPMAHVLSSLGVERGMVVFGQDTMDEFPSAHRPPYASSAAENTRATRFSQRISASRAAARAILSAAPAKKTHRSPVIFCLARNRAQNAILS